MKHSVDAKIQALMDGALRKAVASNGPVKLYHGKTGEGLFDRNRLTTQVGEAGVVRKYWVAERGMTLSVRLVAGGLDRLIEITPARERPALIESASDLYRRELLERWSDMAVARKWEQDFPVIARCCFRLIDGVHKHLPGVGPEKPAPVEPKMTSREADFKRRIAHELVIAWKHAPTTEAKQSLAAALRNSGIQQIGIPRETLPMDGGLHRCDGPAFPGDPVEVVECGWLVHDGVGEYLLEKATVKLL